MTHSSSFDSGAQALEPVFVIGGANIDTTGVAGSRIIAGESTPGKILKTYGGVGRNIAETLSRLNLQTCFASAFGSDVDGQSMFEHLRQAGVETHNIRPEDDAAASCGRTPAFVSIVTTSGESVAQIADMALLDASDARQLDKLVPLIEKAATVVIDANLPEPLLGRIFSMDISAPLVADAVSPAKCHRLSRWLGSCSLLKVNEAEAAALTNTPLNTKGYSERILNDLQQLGPQRILLSRGANGAVLLNGNERFDAASPATTPVNLNGCGDSLLAGVIAASLRDLPGAVQLAWGQRLAARASEVHGAVNPAIAIAELETLSATSTGLPEQKK